MTNTVVFEKTRPGVPDPHRAHDGDIGVDLVAYDVQHNTNEPIGLQSVRDETTGEFTTQYVVNPGKTITFHTGIKTAVPKGYGLFLFVRSSLGFKRGLVLANGTGLIDSQYRGEILVKLHNMSNKTQNITRLERIVQGAVLPVNTTAWVEGVLDETERGEGGFGSSGTH